MKGPLKAKYQHGFESYLELLIIDTPWIVSSSLTKYDQHHRCLIIIIIAADLLFDVPRPGQTLTLDTNFILKHRLLPTLGYAVNCKWTLMCWPKICTNWDRHIQQQIRPGTLSSLCGTKPENETCRLTHWMLYFRKTRRHSRAGILTMSSWMVATLIPMTWTKDIQSSDTGSIRQGDPWSMPAPGLFTKHTVEWRYKWSSISSDTVLILFILQPNYTSIINTCNLWRNFDDIQDSWNSVERTIDYYGDQQDVIIANAGPGHWNDPDMVSTRAENIFPSWRKLFHYHLIHPACDVFWRRFVVCY